jgi:hypothetical protein
MSEPPFTVVLQGRDRPEEIHCEKRPTVGPAGELAVRDGDELIIYAPHAWIKVSGPAPEPHVA